jgi:hypothetical protein
MRDRDARNRVFTLGLPAERRQRRELCRDDHDTSLDLTGDQCHQSRVELLFTAARVESVKWTDSPIGALVNGPSL